MTKEQECMKALQCLYLKVPSVIADDVKQKVIDALNEVKNCTIPDVMQQSELLLEFINWKNDKNNNWLKFIDVKDVDEFLKFKQ